MKMRTARQVSASLLIAGMFLATASTPSYGGADSSFFDQLAGPGEKVELRAEKPADGGENFLRVINGVDGGIDRFLGKGHVILRSPKLNLDADELVYEAKARLLTATGHVVIERPGVRATAGKMVYNLATEETTLTESPDVTQENEQNKTHFTGMEEFVISRKETGETEVRMNGGDQISCEVVPVEAPAGTTEVTPAPGEGSESSDAAPEPTGFGKLGKNVHITSRPRGEKRAEVFVSTSTDGAFSLFRAQGSVLLKSDQMDLRADLLEFDAAKQMVEALYNVYIKQDNLEGDCGRMLYNLVNDDITLSVNPVVRQEQAGGTTLIKDGDILVFTKNPDGTRSMNLNGGPSPSIVWESAVPAEPASNGPKGPKEIQIDEDEDASPAPAAP